MNNSIVSNSLKDTKSIGEKLAKLLKPGDNIALIGELGSGKTTFTKGLASGLGVKDPEYVNSPSFVLLKEYEARINLYHFDLYRIESLGDIDYIGISEYINGDGITVIEWADKMKALMPAEYLKITIRITGKERRVFNFKPYGKRYYNIISRYIES